MGRRVSAMASKEAEMLLRTAKADGVAVIDHPNLSAALDQLWGSCTTDDPIRRYYSMERSTYVYVMARHDDGRWERWLEDSDPASRTSSSRTSDSPGSPSPSESTDSPEPSDGDGGSTSPGPT